MARAMTRSTTSTPGARRPLIVTAEISPSDFSWLEGLRRAHYPLERNQVPAHLTVFHALPPSAEAELRSRLARVVRRSPPKATIDGLMDLGGGVAFRVVSHDLEVIREELADALHGLLGAQDSGGWRPHVTIQNKVANREARQLLDALGAAFEPRPLGIHGLGLHRYLGGPWESLGSWSFRG
jgi:2'-5' RNA ligase superfamily